MQTQHVWTGTFQSDTYRFIHGRLRTNLKPLDEFGYTTKVIVKFEGFVGHLSSIIQSIFGYRLEEEIQVCQGNQFKTKIGKADVVFYIDTPLSRDVKLVKGHYVSQVPSKNYRSQGTFTMKRVD